MNVTDKLMGTMWGMIRQNARMIDRMGRMAAKPDPFATGLQVSGTEYATALAGRIPAVAKGIAYKPQAQKRRAAFSAQEEQKVGKRGYTKSNATDSAAKGTRVSRELDRLMDRERYSASGIAEEDLKHIAGLYGSAIENIYELGAGQKWMLEASRRVKSAFFLQILNKAVINLDLPAFRQQADEVSRKHESLRSAFVCKGVQHPYRVILKDRQPEINCFDLSDLDMEAFDARIPRLMEADRRRGFDLERDPLLRINIYKCCEKDTYAIVISQPHINSDGTSLGILFRDLFVGYALDMNGIDKKVESQNYQSYAEHLNSVDTRKELDFWRETLKDTAADQLLPGQQINALDYDSASLFVPFDERELSLLEQARRTCKVTQFTILQGLWGIMTARLKGRREMVFGAITSGRDAGVTDSMGLSGGFVNAVPVKISFEDDDTIASFFQKVQKDFLSYLENSHLSPGEIQKELGRAEPVFSHLLNNHNFVKPKRSGFSGPVIAGIQMLGGDVYDNLSEDLCVYFTVVDGRQGCNYAYNSRAFSKEVIQLLAESYKTMLSALGEQGAESRVGVLPQIDAEMILAAQDARQIEIGKIAGTLKKHPVFCSASDDALIELAANSRISHYAEDRIIVRKEGLQAELPILFKGKCILYGQTREGWNNPLRVLKEGDILDYSPLFIGEKVPYTVVSGASESTVLFIPIEPLKSFMNAHPEGFIEIAKMLDRDRQRFMALWMGAE